MSTNKQPTSFRLSEDTMQDLEILSKALRCSRAQVVESAVAIYKAWHDDKEMCGKKKQEGGENG